MDDDTDSAPSDIKDTLTKKYGPLPVWGYAVILGGVFIVYFIYKRKATTTTSSTSSTTPAVGTTPITASAPIDTSGSTSGSGSTAMPGYIDPGWLGTLIASLDSHYSSPSSQPGTSPGNSNPPANPTTPTAPVTTPTPNNGNTTINIPQPVAAGAPQTSGMSILDALSLAKRSNPGQFFQMFSPSAFTVSEIQNSGYTVWQPPTGNLGWQEYNPTDYISQGLKVGFLPTGLSLPGGLTAREGYIPPKS